MLVKESLSRSSTAVHANTYDEIYVESWQDTLKECEKTLEKGDRERALGVKSIQDFRNELEALQNKHPDQQSVRATKLIYPVLDDYETFAQNFVAMMAHPVDTSMMWGLLFLVFELALRSTKPPNPLTCITRWLEEIGHKLQISNNCKESITDFASTADIERVRRDIVNVNREIVVLWLNIIMTFRNESYRREVWSNNAWESLTTIYKQAYNNIQEAIQRIKEVAEMTEKHAHSMKDTEMQKRFRLLDKSMEEGATLPCNTLPVAKNRLFFGRQDLLKQLEDHLQPADPKAPLSSIALYGLGGIGKTQTALAYAYQRLDDLDAVLWISAENPFAIQQSFTRIAIDALKLPNAHPQAHAENMLMVLNWLQRTTAKWLLVFDNVDTHDALDNCWPASQHGAVLVTTRDVLIATLPIDTGLEVNEFDVNEGAEFLLHMARKRKHIDSELVVAREVTNMLGGLPLALNQMAALINARNWSISEFEAMYIKNDRRLHKQKKNGWKYLGYEHALDTVWDISFNSLGNEARACLGVLSFLSADSVPSELFRTLEVGDLPDILAFCEDDLNLGDALDELDHHALVRKNIEKGTFRIHRLVQAEYQARMTNPQEEFEAATKLLLGKFPRERSNKYDDEEWILYERYIPQVLALSKNYANSQTKPNALKPNMDFVNLLVNAANAIHDNDTANAVPVFLNTADDAYQTCPEEGRDKLTWAFLQSLKCMYHLCTSEFVKSAEEMTEGLEIRLELLPENDLLVALAYSWLSMAIAGQGRYAEGLDLLLKAGKVLEGPAGEIPTRKLIWGYNTSRNYYCMGRFEEAEKLLKESLADADRNEGWYMQVYGHLTFASLRTRMKRLDDAKHHVDKAKHILNTSGSAARLSWLSSYCAYRAGDVAMKQGRVSDGIKETENAAVIGRLVKVPTGILCRCIHAYSKALAMDPSKAKESEEQRQEARRIRLLIPGGAGDLDDESDEAFDMLVKIDHR